MEINASPLNLLTRKTKVNPKTYLKIKQYKNNLKSDLVQLEITEDIKREGLRVLNDVFESSPIDDVLKIIGTSKSEDTSENCLKKSPQQQVKTYVNKRKITTTPQSKVLESFGLPDDPIVPLIGDKLIFKTFKGLDIEKGSPENVTLVDSFIGKIFQEDLNGICKKMKDNEDNRFIGNKRKSNLGNNNKRRSKNDDKVKTIKKETAIDTDFAIIIKENYNKMTNKPNDVSKNEAIVIKGNQKINELKQDFNHVNKDVNIKEENHIVEKVKGKRGRKKKNGIRHNNQPKINGAHFNNLSDIINSKVIVKETIEENEIKLEENNELDDHHDQLDIEFFPGELMWARFGKFPYWPCMVTSHPQTDKTTRYINSQKLEVYVRFFGDRGRCSWIPKTHLLPYSTLEELDQCLSINKKHLAHASARSHYVKNWRVAIREADSLKNKSLDEKFKFFESVLKEQEEILREKKLKKQLNRVAKRKLSLEDNKDVIPLAQNEINSPPAKRKRIKSEEIVDNNIDNIENKPFSVTLEEQTLLYKRNNLFKGVTREKVCHFCLKSGIVLRCKGKCQGFYHSECIKKNAESLSNKNNSFNKTQVKIVSIKDRRRLTPTNLNLNEQSDEFKELSLSDKIDSKMNEVMKDFNDKALYLESTDSSCYESSVDLNADDLDSIDNDICKSCLTNSSPTVCFICENNFEYNPSDGSFSKSEVEMNSSLDKQNGSISGDVTPKVEEENHVQRCSSSKCNKFFHPHCLKKWPQTQWSITSTRKHKSPGINSNSNEFICPTHFCHICVYDDPRSLTSRFYGDKLVKCIYCPTTYHMATCCIPAGTQILSSTQIICTKHFGASFHQSNSSTKTKRILPINTTWCFICSKGGALICCETCPTSVHAECVAVKYDVDDKFICEDCEFGRFPLYDEVVWVKLGYYRWWPALIMFPNEVPDKINEMKHRPGEFVVMFFGTYNYYWIGRERVFVFEEGDDSGSGGGNGQKKKMEEIFKKSIEEATQAFLLKREFKESYKNKSRIRPPPYVKIKVNRPVGNVRQFDGNISNTTPCECSKLQENPCGPDSDCLNRLLLTECDPTVCPAGSNCQNQCFEQRIYPDLVPYKTEARGWGLKSLEPLRKGQFIIEYVGEMIDEIEYQRRIKQMNEIKEDNYYFLTIDKDRMIDAGLKGNLARFMNHSCKPNCETQKWTVNGDTRVGLFALEDIPENVELTFNYNLECIGKEKKICLCGASNCSGFIGVKVNKPQTTSNNMRKKRKKRSKKRHLESIQSTVKKCFVCGLIDEDLKLCDNKSCLNYYHLKCVGLENWPENNRKWICPWHTCTICTQRTIRCCTKCLNSYCPKHSEGNIRHDDKNGFVCSMHDSLRQPKEVEFHTVDVDENETSLTAANATVINNEELEKKDKQYLEKEGKNNFLGVDQKINGLIILTPNKINSKRKRNNKNNTNSFKSKRKRSDVGNTNSVQEKRTLRSGSVTNNNVVSEKL
ncbi:histone-lysine N-methyltransferase NSD2 [Onthophagus taurus]|uniref:histone-lysine N-methyltransferase NSD2 n=1 Tax=Onthophagus taurus TaxID=166361 RepID=UPI0039BE9295